MAIALSARERGVHWTLDRGSDLNINLVFLPEGAIIDEHVIADRDVLLTGLRGRGEVVIEGVATTLGAQEMLLVEAGERRLIRALEDFAYLSAHRRREPLSIRARRGEPALGEKAITD
jgi:quercetin dioxygenase-like cupin family protein